MSFEADVATSRPTFPCPGPCQRGVSVDAGSARGSKVGKEGNRKCLFAGVGNHVSRINDVYDYEDTTIRDCVMRLITREHDCIDRMHWTKQACAIWSNECTLHAATVRRFPIAKRSGTDTVAQPDAHLVNGIRVGVRTSGIGGVPYIDPVSTGRREALELPPN